MVGSGSHAAAVCSAAIVCVRREVLQLAQGGVRVFSCLAGKLGVVGHFPLEEEG